MKNCIDCFCEIDQDMVQIVCVWNLNSIERILFKRNGICVLFWYPFFKPVILI